MAKKLTQSKAKQILHDKSVHGHPLTDKQRRFFGAIAGGAPIKAQGGENILPNYNFPLEEYQRPFINPYGYSFSPEENPNVKIYGLGAQAQYDVNDRLNIHGGLNTQSVFYPGGSDMFMKPTYNVGLTYKFEKGGWLDKFGENINANEGTSSAPEGWVGEGYSTKGRNYSPAWGGQFQKGGDIPSKYQPIKFPQIDTNPPVKTTNTGGGGGGRNRNNWLLGAGLGLGAAGLLYALLNRKRSGSSSDDRCQTGMIWDEENQQCVPDPTYERKIYYPDYGGGSNYTNIDTPEQAQGVSPMYNDAIVWRYTSPEGNTRSNLISGGREVSGVPVSSIAAMGASIPGSVGFTYARTQGAAPSEGPYAKKTLPSAEHGMSYYQHGLDWKPKTISKNGSLIPIAQTGKFVLPSARDIARANMPASESTAITFQTPKGKKSTATTGQKKEDVKASSEAMGKGKRTEERMKAQRIAERKAAVAAKDQGKPFTLPTGETKKYEDMDAREKMYVSGKALEQRGRINENDEAWYDEYLNPLYWTTGAAAGLAEAPLQAKLSNSNLPYLQAIAEPLIGGALGFDPLGAAMKVPGKVAQSMESGLLSKTYKLNPWAFKPNPEAGYRMIGGKEGYLDAIRSGQIRPTGAYEHAHFNIGQPLNPNRLSAEELIEAGSPGGYKGPYMAEMKQGTWQRMSDAFPNNPEMQEQLRLLGKDKDVWQHPLFGHIKVDDPRLKLYKEDWLRGYKEVPKPTSNVVESTSAPLKSGFPNPLAIADAITPRLNPFSFIEDGPDLMSMSPLNLIPGYGKKLSGKGQAFRKFGNSMQDVIERQALSPKGGSPLRMGKSQIVSEGNWAAPDIPWEKYPGVFEATFDFTHPERNIAMKGSRDRGGVLITDRQGNLLPDIPLTEPGMSFNRRLPFSTRYVPIDKQKLMDNKFQLATFAPHLQSLAEKYGIGLGGAATLGAMGYPDAVEKYNQYTIDPIKNWTKEQWKDYQKSDVYKKFRELDESVGLDFLYDKKKKGGVIKDNMGYWNPDNWGKVVEIDSPNITMKNVEYGPLLGISKQTGEEKVMLPGKDYTFANTKQVIEKPLNKKSTGGWLDKYN